MRKKSFFFQIYFVIKRYFTLLTIFGQVFAFKNRVRWVAVISAKKHKRKAPRAPIRNRQTRKVANAKVLNRNTNLT